MNWEIQQNANGVCGYCEPLQWVQWGAGGNIFLENLQYLT